MLILNGSLLKKPASADTTVDRTRSLANVVVPLIARSVGRKYRTFAFRRGRLTLDLDRRNSRSPQARTTGPSAASSAPRSEIRVEGQLVQERAGRAYSGPSSRPAEIAEEDLAEDLSDSVARTDDREGDVEARLLSRTGGDVAGDATVPPRTTATGFRVVRKVCRTVP